MSDFNKFTESEKQFAEDMLRRRIKVECKHLHIHLNHLGTVCSDCGEQLINNMEPRMKQEQNSLTGSSSILSEAQSVIYGDREKTYGSPDKNLQVIADLWNAYFHANKVSSMFVPFSVDDVCMMMILLKVARLKNQPNHRDSQVDICGYAALMERVQNVRSVKQNNSNQSGSIENATKILNSRDSSNL